MVGGNGRVHGGCVYILCECVCAQVITVQHVLTAMAQNTPDWSGVTENVLMLMCLKICEVEEPQKSIIRSGESNTGKNYAKSLSNTRVRDDVI